MTGKHIILISSLVAGLGGFLFGFDTAVISGATQALKDLYSLDASMLGFTVSIALIGTMVGAFSSGIPGDVWGRKKCLMATGLLFFLSALGCAIAWDWYSLLFFRFIGGIGVGSASVLGPMYIAEIAPARLRGRLVGLFQFNIVFGILIAYFSNYLIGLLNSGAIEWRIKLGVEAIPALLFFGLLFLIPHSPRWLVKKSRENEALQVLETIDSENSRREFDEIVNSINKDSMEQNVSLFSKKYYFPIFLAVSIAMFNQLTGINAILYYLNDIFSMAGFSKVSGDIQAVVIGGTNLLFTIIAMSIIDKVGRKLLLLVGALGTAVCLSATAFIFLTSSYAEYLIWFLIGFIASFAISQGAVIWVYLSEIFPNIIRAKGQALGSFTHWFMCAVISFVFPIMAAKSGGYPFVFFAFMMIVQFFAVLFVYPETKGVTLEELQKKLLKEEHNETEPVLNA